MGVVEEIEERLKNPPPCIGSGFCCKKSLCMMGVRVHGSMPGPCPSLMFKDERYWCGEVLKADGEKKQWLKDNLYIGDGRSANLNSDRKTMSVKLRSRSNS